MAATISISDMSSYFANLLAFEYRNAPKAYAQMRLWAKQALADLFAFQVQDAFDVDTAIGAQLDVIGKYVGVNRNIGTPVTKPYFGFYDNTATVKNPNGFTDSTNPAINAVGIFFQSYFIGSENTALNDEAYRLVIKLQIILNQNDGTLASIQTYLHNFLPGVVSLTDNADMTLTYTLSSVTPVDPSVLQKFLPKPAGVGVNFIYFTATASPLTLSGTRVGFGTATVSTSGNTTATVSNGVGPYIYSWRRVSGSTDMSFASSSASANFTATLLENQTKIGTFQCVVSDSRGFSATTDSVSVTLINHT